MTTNGLTNNGQISVNGDLDTAWYEQASTNAVVITDGTFAILGNKPAATTTQAEGDEEAPKAFENAVKVQTVSFTSSSTGEEPNLGVLSVGASTAAANAAVADAYGEIDADKSVIYIAKQAVFGDGTAALTVGGDQQATDLLVDIQELLARPVMPLRTASCRTLSPLQTELRSRSSASRTRLLQPLKAKTVRRRLSLLPPPPAR